MDLIGWFQAFEPSVRVSILALTIAAISLPIAVAGLCLSIRNSNMQKVSLRLASDQEKRRKSNLKVECLRANGYRTGSAQNYDFEVAILNQSDSDASISDAELFIRYFHKSKTMTLTTRSSRTPASNKSSTQLLYIPADISGRRTVGGVLRFEFPAATLTGKRIKDYKLRVTDTFNTCTEVEMDFVLDGGPL